MCKLQCIVLNIAWPAAHKASCKCSLVDGRFWASPSALVPKQASLFGSDVSLESPLEGCLLWDALLPELNLAQPGVEWFFDFNLDIF